MKKQSYLYLLIAATVSAFAFSSCNTMRGAGQDIEAVGDGVQHATHRH